MEKLGTTPVTLVDMARHLNLSPSAVSQALRPTQTSTTKVSETTVQAVRELAEKWNYRPNSSARRMKGQAAQQAGFILEYRFENRTIPWVDMPAVLGVSDYLMAHQWHLNIIQHERDRTIPKQLPHFLQDNSLDGVILASSGLERDEVVLRDLKKCRVPAVLLNGVGERNAVVLDDALGETMATQHLLDLGHQKIVFISSLDGNPMWATLREQAYIATMKKAGLTPQVWIYSIPQAGLSEPEAMRHHVNELRKKEFYYDLYMPQKPTALVCVQDIDALRLSQMLLQKGVRIPEDISIVGYDDLPYLDLHFPPLTTVRSNFYEMGKCAAEMLLNLIKNKVATLPAVTIKPELIVRQSTAAPRR